MTVQTALKIELIVAVCSKPRHLSLVVSSIKQQSVPPYSICFAEDGDDPRVAGIIGDFAAGAQGVNVRHLRQKNEGFRKNNILNRAVVTSDADYLIFIDDDCVIHPKYIERHASEAQWGTFLSGSAIRLTAPYSQSLLDKGFIDWSPRLSLIGWRASRGSEWLKSMPLSLRICRKMDRLLPTRVSWAGGNSSTFREHILNVNGFDETMGYGAEDKEFGARLLNNGIKGRHLRYSAPVYHVEHQRHYVDDAMLLSNRARLNYVRKNKIVWTNNGITSDS